VGLFLIPCKATSQYIVRRELKGYAGPSWVVHGVGGRCKVILIMYHI